ncbi:tripartite tricarboxylate transporter TctB family protein [Chachezhania antarctica]|mgnify:FL=1|uniref:tripartite tricarboxylate transporter TctB family protein n=1 Tax=Chachezhania antarctica TaxID=2340860 RepID=UPI000EB4D219|nr:tripartite tricarboxylate transporter TctB family protein [Chachezhania antarctica]|tara:strand:- start:6276 stop:6737 length:462 start_codon:yes stop_codon:yes gene_type:complete
MTRQALFALFILALDVAYLQQALQLPRPFATGEPGPSLMPMVLVFTLGLGALGVLVQELRGTAVHDDDEDANFSLRTVALIALTCGFAWAFEPLGYVYATLCYAFGVAWLFEQERLGPVKAILTSVVISAGITGVGWLFFVTLFDLFLPSGYF